MFFKQKNEIKHMHTKVVVVVKIFVCLPEVSCPRQHNKCDVDSVSEPTHTVSHRPPKTEHMYMSASAQNCQLPFLSQWKGSNLMISLYDNYVAGLGLELVNL